MRLLALLLVLLSLPAAALARVCADPCLEAARGDYVACRRSATGAFLVERQLCLDRDLGCVQACAVQQEDCDDATGLGPALEGCGSQLEAAVSQCRDRFPAGANANKRGKCIENARIASFQCRNRARTDAQPALRRCRGELDLCAARCGPADAPRGVRLCRCCRT